MPIDKKYWSETEGLMAFAIENGLPVVPRIYEFEGRQYPVWEQTVNYRQKNVWLISTTDLRNKPNQTPSLPDLRAQNGGYYIFGFIYNIRQQGQGRSRVELQRYLAQRTNRQDEWTVLDWNGNPVQPISPSSAQNKPATKQAVAKSSPRKSAAPAQPAGKNVVLSSTGTYANIIKKTELQYACAIAERFGVSKPENGDVNAAVKNWEKENPELFHSLFHSADDLERIDQFNAKCQELKYATQKFALFELVIGDVQNAKMIILNNNPGTKSLSQSPDNLKAAVNNFVDFLDIFVKSQQNAGQQNLKNIYYPFDRRFIKLDCDYFPKRFLNIRSNSSPRLFDCLLRGCFCTKKEKSSIPQQYPDRYFAVWEKVAPYIVSLERFGYHSSYFNENELQHIFTQQRQVVADILHTMLGRPLETRPIILVFRGESGWKDLLGDNFFAKYQKVYFVANPLNPNASVSQIGSERFQQLKRDWNALVNDPRLKLQ